MSSMTGFTGRAPATALAGQKLAGGYKQGQMPLYTPEQSKLFGEMFQHVSPDSYTSRLARGDQDLFAEQEAPALRQFNEVQGNLASRFSGAGTGGRRSSGFQNTMNQASSDFAQDLQGRRQELQRNAIRDLLSMSHTLLNEQPYENYYIEPKKKQSLWQKLLAGGLPIAGAAAGGIFGGPMGAAAGAQLGSAAGSAFSGGQQQPMDFSALSGLPTNWNRGGDLTGASGGYGGQQQYARQSRVGAY